MAKSLSKNTLLCALFCLPTLGHADSAHHFSHAPFHVSSIFGDTYINGKGDNETIGIDLEYRVSEFTGLGMVIEHAFGELNATTVLAVADLHLHDGLIMQIGPGYEFIDSESILVSRVGFIYEFEFEGFTVAPQLHWDWHDGHEDAVVAGIALGFGF